MVKLINKKIKHTVFGDGKVISQEIQRVSVQFSDEYGTKQFVYPDAFGKYLKLSDANLETAVMEELHSKQDQLKDESEKRQQHYVEQKADEKLKLETEKKKATKKSKAK